MRMNGAAPFQAVNGLLTIALAWGAEWGSDREVGQAVSAAGDTEKSIMRSLMQGAMGLALLGGAAGAPGSAHALASFESSASVVIGLGFEAGACDVAIGSCAGPGGVTIADGSPVNRPTGSAAAPGVSIDTDFHPGLASAGFVQQPFSRNFNPAVSVGTFNDITDPTGPAALATPQRQRLTAEADNGGGWIGGIVPGATIDGVTTPFPGGRTSLVTVQITNSSSTDYVLDFVAIPNLLAWASADPGDFAEVASAFNLAMSSNYSTGGVETLDEFGDASTQQRGVTPSGPIDLGPFMDTEFDVATFAADSRVDEDGTQTDVVDVPDFIWFSLDVPGNSSGGFVFQYQAYGILNTQAPPMPEAIPVPAALPLLLSGIAGIVALRRRRASR